LLQTPGVRRFGDRLFYSSAWLDSDLGRGETEKKEEEADVEVDQEPT
jgi:hypothetical protein